MKSRMEIQQDIEQIQKICPGCKAGITWYQRMDGKLQHVDIFATYEYGTIFPCLAESLVEKYITEYRPNKSAILTDEFFKLLSTELNDSEDESLESED